MGVAWGVILSLLWFVWKTSRPHVAEVGQVPGSQHFRNIHRHDVITDPTVLTLRIDESLYFANARRMEDLILARVHGDKALRHVILMCSAVNEIDTTRAAASRWRRGTSTAAMLWMGAHWKPAAVPERNWRITILHGVNRSAV